MTTRLPDASQNAAADAVVDRVDAGAGAGVLEIFDGTAPTDADDTDAGTLLVSVTLADPAYGDASGGTAALQGTPRSATASAGGTASYFRVKDSAGNVVFQGDCRASGDPDNGEELVLDNTNIANGQTVNINSLNYTHPATE